MYALNNNVTYFDGFRVELIPKEIKKIIENNIETNIFRMQAYNSVMCGYFCVGVIDFMLNFTNLFLLNNSKKKC